MTASTSPLSSASPSSGPNSRVTVSANVMRVLLRVGQPEVALGPLETLGGGAEDVVEPGEVGDGGGLGVATNDERVAVDGRGHVEQRRSQFLERRRDDRDDVVGISARRRIGRQSCLGAADVVDDQVEVAVADAVDGFGAESGRRLDVDVVAVGLQVLAVHLGDRDRLAEVLSAQPDGRPSTASRRRLGRGVAASVRRARRGRRRCRRRPRAGRTRRVAPGTSGPDSERSSGSS